MEGGHSDVVRYLVDHSEMDITQFDQVHTYVRDGFNECSSHYNYSVQASIVYL